MQQPDIHDLINFGEVFSYAQKGVSTMSQVSSNDTFDREVYKNQKKEEKDRIFEMLSEETQALLDPKKLKA